MLKVSMKFCSISGTVLDFREIRAGFVPSNKRKWAWIAQSCDDCVSTGGKCRIRFGVGFLQHTDVIVIRKTVRS